jgi:hypothetical protein
LKNVVFAADVVGALNLITSKIVDKQPESFESYQLQDSLLNFLDMLVFDLSFLNEAKQSVTTKKALQNQERSKSFENFKMAMSSFMVLINFCQRVEQKRIAYALTNRYTRALGRKKAFRKPLFSLPQNRFSRLGLERLFTY